MIHGRLRNPGVTIYDANLIIFQLQFAYIKAPEVKMAFFFMPAPSENILKAIWHMAIKTSFFSATER